MGTGQAWDASRYAEHGRFVARMASAVVDLLIPRWGERLLDVGCGDGALTEVLSRRGAHVVGIDASAAMVRAARARGLDVVHRSAVEMEFAGEFDAVFSNAALHWIGWAEQPQALANVARALRPGGRFVAEMGGQGNIAAIRTALSAVLGPLGVDAEAASGSCFPSVAQYRGLLEEAGFWVRTIVLAPRPTPLPGGEEGMAIWLNTFRNGVLERLPAGQRQAAIEETIRLLRPVLSDGEGAWRADYVRLRFEAVRE